jgi:SAM-dependent methyltransferase
MITQSRFLHLALSRHKAFPRVLSLLKSPPPPTATALPTPPQSQSPEPHHLPSPATLGAPLASPYTFLDIGSGLTQDVRHLLHHGILASSLYALELNSRFFEYGDTLFLDRDNSRPIEDVNFIVGDLLNLSDALPQLQQSFGIIHAASFFHLFSFERQQHFARAILQLLRPSAGAMILGWQIGSHDPMDYFDFTNLGLQYRHNEDSLREFWREIGGEAGMKLEVETRMWRRESDEGSGGVGGMESYWVLEWRVVRT